MPPSSTFLTSLRFIVGGGIAWMGGLRRVADRPFNQSLNS
ncbi:hypothetical protein CGRA01v4_08141 [Colletotrichum graminicola]|nr:hypothetical protein CGRA01v4_08141 [Colletotrichum graminicola]